MRYIYKSPEECARALRLIMENTKGEESINALDTAIKYLEVLQMVCNKEKAERSRNEH